MAEEGAGHAQQLPLAQGEVLAALLHLGEQAWDWVGSVGWVVSWVCGWGSVGGGWKKGGREGALTDTHIHPHLVTVCVHTDRHNHTQRHTDPDTQSHTQPHNRGHTVGQPSDLVRQVCALQRPPHRRVVVLYCVCVCVCEFMCGWGSIYSIIPCGDNHAPPNRGAKHTPPPQPKTIIVFKLKLINQSTRTWSKGSRLKRTVPVNSTGSCFVCF